MKDRKLVDWCDELIVQRRATGVRRHGERNGHLVCGKRLADATKRAKSIARQTRLCETCSQPFVMHRAKAQHGELRETQRTKHTDCIYSIGSSAQVASTFSGHFVWMKLSMSWQFRSKASRSAARLICFESFLSVGSSGCRGMDSPITVSELIYNSQRNMPVALGA